MKHFIILCLLLSCISLTAQPGNSGKGFNYQGVARATDGQPRASENIELRFSFLPEVGLEAVWEESHVATTSPFGVFAVIVGKGIKVGGRFEAYRDIAFAEHDYWRKIDLKEAGEWKELSMFQLPSMPYAEVAHSSPNASAVPVGSIIPFAGPVENIPEGWLLCDGSTLDREEHRTLYAVIGTAWGEGNGSTTFHTPDLRSMFLRGVSHGRTAFAPDRNNRRAMRTGGNTNNKVGSLQTDEFKIHNHSGRTANDGSHQHGVWYHSGSAETGVERNVVSINNKRETKDGLQTSDRYSEHRHDFVTNNSGGSETRADNAYVNFIIKY